MRHIKNKIVVSFIVAMGSVFIVNPIDASAKEISIFNEFFHRQTMKVLKASNSALKDKINEIYNNDLTGQVFIQRLVDGLNALNNGTTYTVQDLLDDPTDIHLIEELIVSADTPDDYLQVLKICTKLKKLTVTTFTNQNGQFNLGILNHISTNIEYLSLKNLNITDEQLSKLSLSNLENLIELDLSGNKITNLGPLSSMKKLQKLSVRSLNGNIGGLRDLSGISTLFELKELDVHGNQIESVEPLKELTNLEKLDISKNKIADLSVLSPLKSDKDNNRPLKEIIATDQQIKAKEVLKVIKQDRIQVGQEVYEVYAESFSKFPARSLFADMYTRGLFAYNSPDKGGVETQDGIIWPKDAVEQEFKTTTANTIEVSHKFKEEEDPKLKPEDKKNRTKVQFDGTVTYEIERNNKPEISISTSNTINIIVGDERNSINLNDKLISSILQDVKATDKEDGDLTTKMTVTLDLGNKKLTDSYDEKTKKFTNNIDDYFLGIKNLPPTTVGTISYTVTDDYDETVVKDITVKVHMNTKPVVIPQKYNSSTLKDHNYLIGEKFDPTTLINPIEITPKDLENFKKDSLFGITEGDKRFVDVEDVNEQFPFTFYKHPKEYIKRVVKPVILNSNKVINAEEIQDPTYSNKIKAPIKNTISVYEVKYSVKDSNGGWSDEEIVTFVVTNYAPEVSINHEIEGKKSDKNFIFKDEIVAGISIKDFESTDNQPIVIYKETLEDDLELLASKGIKIEWPDNIQEATFTSVLQDKINVDFLPAGEYLLNYRITDSDGNQSIANKILRLTHPPYPVVNFKENQNRLVIRAGELEEFKSKATEILKPMLDISLADPTEETTMTAKFMLDGQDKPLPENEVVAPKPSNDDYQIDYDVLVTVEDSNGTGGATLDLKVTNYLPVINGIDEDISIFEGESVDLLEGVTVIDKEAEREGKQLEVTVTEKGEESFLKKLFGKSNLQTTENLEVGEHTLIYTVTDDDGNTVTKERRVDVKPVSASVVEIKDNIKLNDNGDILLTISEAKEFDPLNCIKPIDKSKYKINTSLTYKNDPIEKLLSKPGPTNVDSGGYLTYEVIYDVRKLDNSPIPGGIDKRRILVTNYIPSIELEEGTAKEITLKQNTDADLKKGVIVNDFEDGDLTRNTTYTIFDSSGKDKGSNTSELEPGNYEIEYTVKDKDSNVMKERRKLTIISTDGSNSNGNTSGGNNGGNDSSGNNNSNSSSKLFVGLSDLTGSNSLSLSEADEFKKDPLKGITIKSNSYGLTAKDIVVTGLEDFNPREDLKGDTRTKEYTITYELKKKENKLASLFVDIAYAEGSDVVEKAQRKVVVTNEKPEVTGNDLTVSLSSKIDPFEGIVAKDAEDGELDPKKSVKVSPDPASIDTSVAGEHELTYVATDSDNNESEKFVRTVAVVDKPANQNNNSSNNNNTQNQNNNNQTQDNNNQNTNQNSNNQQNADNQGQENIDETLEEEKEDNPITGEKSMGIIFVLAIVSIVGLVVVNKR